MGRAALKNTRNIAISVALIAGVLGSVAGIAYGITLHRDGVKTIADSRHHIVQVSYRGEAGVDALTLFKRHAIVRTRHYSFGDMVVSVDGTIGSGPKYWTFYINGRMANVGAQAYITKSTDILMWKLQ